ncbi:hypothetical protein ACET3Z_008964 [Daucus carota]
MRRLAQTFERSHPSCEAIEGRCKVRKKSDLLSCDAPTIYEHVFFCEYMYDPHKGSLKQLSSNIKLRYSTVKGAYFCIVLILSLSLPDQALILLLPLMSFVQLRWAIEYEEPVGDAFKINHPDTTNAVDLASKLSEEELKNLPLPGQVDYMNGGPSCHGSSGINRFNQSFWSKVQCEMILAFLSFADYYRPKYFLLDNVRNFVSLNKGQTFCLAIASLLEMGYQVRFGILEAGAFGVPQSWKRLYGQHLLKKLSRSG